MINDQKPNHSSTFALQKIKMSWSENEPLFTIRALQNIKMSWWKYLDVKEQIIKYPKARISPKCRFHCTHSNSSEIFSTHTSTATSFRRSSSVWTMPTEEGRGKLPPDTFLGQTGLNKTPEGCHWQTIVFVSILKKSLVGCVPDRWPKTATNIEIESKVRNVHHEPLFDGDRRGSKNKAAIAASHSSCTNKLYNFEHEMSLTNAYSCNKQF